LNDGSIDTALAGVDDTLSSRPCTRCSIRMDVHAYLDPKKGLCAMYARGMRA
jgi:hypothetical protein